jgi:integrase
MGLADARQEWRNAYERLKAGLDPRPSEGASTPSADTADIFRVVAADWLKRDQRENRSHDEVKRIIDKEVLPTLGHLPIAAITRRQLGNLFDDITDRGAPTLARRCHAHLHRMFRWSVGRGIIETSPMVYLPKPGEEVKRKRVLSDVEIKLLWDAALQIGWPFGDVYRLLLLTCARRDEIGELQRHEIDGDTIHLKGDRTKNNEDHDIPLSTMAREIIDAAPRISGCPFVFSTTGTTAVSGWSNAKESLDKIMQANAEGKLEGWRIHDIRRTVATGLERLGVKQQVVEALLNHTAGSKVGITAVYQRYAYETEKRQALKTWAKHVASVVQRKRELGAALQLSRGSW